MKGVKIVDSSTSITEGSRADNYWKANGWDKIYTKLRPGMKLPKGFETNNPAFIVQKFNLKHLGFGNWTTIEDRLNYLYVLVFAMYDLNKVLGFNYNMGFGQLSITFGARGRGGALAHYEPGSDIINITRYEEGSLLGGLFGNNSPKEVRFMTTGGVGSLAHEYGHFLDYFAGANLEPNPQVYSLSNGDSVAMDRVGLKTPLRQTMDEILEAIIWEKPGVKESRFYNRLIKDLQETSKGDYWKRRNELFARTFEAWVLWKLKKMNIKNLLLTAPKYNPQVYLTPSEIQNISPLFEKFVRQFKGYFK